jgi:2-aminoethylphosphonate dioxygenase
MNNNNQLFWKDGFLLLRDFFSVEEGEKIQSWFNELEQWKEEKGKWMIYFQEDGKRARIENIINFHPEIKNFIETRITPAINEVYQKPMNIFKDKMNWKKGYGKGFKSHQDQPAWTDFPSERYVTVAFFGNHTTRENGCLQFARGEHDKGLHPHNIEGGGEMIEKGFNWEHVLTSPRDLLMFDSYVPHRSDENSTPNDRRIFYLTYNPAEDGDFYLDYIRKKREVLPPDIEREEGKDYNIGGTKYNLANPIN